MIYFRQVDEPRISKGVFWQVEFYAEEGSVFPVGNAYVESPPCGPPRMNFMMVADQWRGRGIASAMMAACVEKWPDLEFSAPISRGGAKAIDRAARLRTGGETAGEVGGFIPRLDGKPGFYSSS